MKDPIIQLEAELAAVTEKQFATREAYYTALAEYTKKCDALAVTKDQLCREWVETTNKRHALEMAIERLKQ